MSANDSVALPACHTSIAMDLRPVGAGTTFPRCQHSVAKSRVCCRQRDVRDKDVVQISSSNDKEPDVILDNELISHFSAKVRYQLIDNQNTPEHSLINFRAIHHPHVLASTLEKLYFRDTMRSADMNHCIKRMRKSTEMQA